MPISARHTQPHLAPSATGFDGGMASFPAPFGQDFPNLEKALTENVPVLCTLLVGFIGLLFVTIATVDTKEVMHTVTYRPLIVGCPQVFEVPGKNFTLWVAGIDCLLFYLAVVSIIYARMSQYRGLVSNAELIALREREPLVREEEKRLDRRRESYVTICMFLFNTGISSLPLALIPFTDKRSRQSIVIDLVVVLLIYSVWALKGRLTRSS